MTSTSGAPKQYLQVNDIVIEDGSAARLGALLVKRYAPCPVFIVTDKGIIGLGLMEGALASLREHGFAVTIFSDIVPDPAEDLVLNAARQARAASTQLVIGFGGGSSMDTAKVVAALVVSDQEIGDMYGIGNVMGPCLPVIQVPTTAGTGSEVTAVAIITTGATTKMGIVSPHLMSDVAILDAVLTAGLPRMITAATGIDAMVHAIEAYTSKYLKNDRSDACALKALKLLGDNLLTACNDGSNLGARRAMMHGALLAGEAFANSPVAAVHALAYPLGGHFHVSHGLSNALVLPHVLKFTMPNAGHLYAELADHVGVSGGGEGFVVWLEGLCMQTGVERRLRDVGVAENDLELLATDAMKQTRLLGNNMRDVDYGAALQIYRDAW